MIARDPRLTDASVAAFAASVKDWDFFRGRVFVAVLGVSLFASFFKVLLGLETFFYRDFGALVYPALFYLRERILSGQLPFWNPYNHCGVPFMAQWGYWYPGNIIIVLLPMPWAANFFLIFHLFFAGLGMHWLCRRLGATGFAAGFAAMAYAFNGITMSCLGWTSYTASLAWLPWVMGLTTAAWRTGGRAIGPAALASAIQVMAGAPEITLLFWIFLGTVWISDAAVRMVPFWKSFLRLVAVVLLAAGITAGQMLPFIDLLAHSQRDRNYGGTGWAMPGWGWANLLVPLFHCYQAPQGTWFQPGQDLINSYYLGPSILVLGAAGVWLRRSRFDVCVAGMALFCWIMALGSDGFIYDWVRRVFPPIGIARFPVKFAVLPAFLVPLAAVAGVESLLSARDERSYRLVAVLALVVLSLMVGLLWFACAYPFPYDNWPVTVRNTGWRAVLMLATLGGLACLARLRGRRTRGLLGAAVLTVLPVDALTHSPGVVPTLPASFLEQKFWSVGGNPTAPKLGQGRIMLSREAEHRLVYSEIRDLALDFTAKRLGEWYNLNLLDEIPKVTGASILRPAYFDRIEKYVYYAGATQVGRGLLDFLSVSYTSSPQDPTHWSARTNCLPLITAGQQAAFETDEQVLANLVADDFDPRQTVYLPESERRRVAVSRKTDCTITDTHFADNEAEMKVAARETSLVVISQSFYHLWRAWVDGQPARLMRANLAFQAIEIPPGTHYVRLAYKDPNFYLGACISVVSLMLSGWIWLARPRTDVG
jgi:hypothetical protein